MLTELECLEGWLIKKKRADKVSYFGGDTKRWFKMQKLKVNYNVKNAIFTNCCVKINLK